MSNIANNQRMANLANAKITSDITSSATSVTVDDASIFPSPVFFATLMPGDEMSNENNSEIVKVTAVNSNTFTITRAQRGTTARAFATGSVLTNGSYIEDLEYAQSVGRTAFNTSYSQGVYTIVDNVDMLPNTPTDGMRITIIVNTDSVGTPGLDLRGNGSIYSIYTGVQFNGDYYNDPAVLYSGKMYDLEFNNGNWYATNVAAQITSDDVDPDYASTIAYLSGNQVTPSSHVYVDTDNIQNGAVTSDKIDWTTLYSSDTGVQTDFILSDNPSNYEYVDVYFSKQNFTDCKLCSRFSGSSTRWYLLAINPGIGADSTLYFNSSTLLISGTSVSYTAGKEGYFGSSSQSVGQDTKPLKIFKVIGYR